MNRCRNRVFGNGVALCELDFASDTMLDGLTVSPHRVGTTGCPRHRHGGRAGIWVTKC